MPRATASFVIMTRAPVVGRTKTRLIPTLGAEAACAFARASLEDLAERFDRVFVGRKLVAWADGDEAPPGLDLPSGYEHVAQGDGDLGMRMLRLFGSLGPPVVFVGSDAPDLPSSAVEDALVLLDAGADLVCQPALDGGYTLVAFAADPRAVLEGIPWGGPEVLAETLRRADDAGLVSRVLDPWYDVDDGSGLRILRARLEGRDHLPDVPRRTLRLMRRIWSQNDERYPQPRFRSDNREAEAGRSGPAGALERPLQ